MSNDGFIDETLIRDAVADQRGGLWIQFGRADKPVWFSINELQSQPQKVFGRISGPGTVFLTSASQVRFKSLVEAHTEYREALVASRPGWIENHYVFGDGETVGPERDKRKIIVSFEPQDKFVPCGSLSRWLEDIAPIVNGQPLLMFALAYAFVGPLLRFSPADVQNPIVELVGNGGGGKTTAGILAASVWAGRSKTSVGGGQSWEVTLNAIDQLKRRHGDSYLFLDEGGLIGADRKQQRELIERAVFKLAGTEEKVRHGDEGDGEHIHFGSLTGSSLISTKYGMP